MQLKRDIKTAGKIICQIGIQSSVFLPCESVADEPEWNTSNVYVNIITWRNKGRQRALLLVSSFQNTICFSIQVAVGDTTVLHLQLWFRFNSLLYYYLLYALLFRLLFASLNRCNLFFFCNLSHQRLVGSLVFGQQFQLLSIYRLIKHQLVLDIWNELKLSPLLLLTSQKCCLSH